MRGSEGCPTLAAADEKTAPPEGRGGAAGWAAAGVTLAGIAGPFAGAGGATGGAAGGLDGLAPALVLEVQLGVLDERGHLQRVAEALDADIQLGLADGDGAGLGQHGAGALVALAGGALLGGGDVLGGGLVAG